MARIYKPKFPKMQTVLGADGKRVMEARVATRGPNKGRKVLVPRRQAVRGRDGKPIYVESSKWAIDYSDAGGRRRTAGGYTDKTATLQKAAAIDKAVARQREGITHVDVHHNETAVTKHIAAWLADLDRAGRSPEYIRKVKARIERLQKELQWTRPSTIRADKFAEWLAIEARKGTSQRTINHFIEAAMAFCNWSVGQLRLESNPLKRVTKVHSIEPKRKRRALTVEELQKLVAVHPVRGTIYLTAALTGLRRRELASLQWGDVHLECTRPYILLRASTTKSRRADTVALNDEIASRLRDYRPEQADPTRVVFAYIPKSSTFASDLGAAGLERDVDGKRSDFHSLRVTHATLLATSGVSIREAMEQMRHTDIRLTTRVYTDPRLFDLSRAVNSLPNIVAAIPDHESVRATGTDHVSPNIRSDIRKELAASGRKGSKMASSESVSASQEISANADECHSYGTRDEWRRGESKIFNRFFVSR